MTPRHKATTGRVAQSERRGWSRYVLPRDGDLIVALRDLQERGIPIDFDSRNRLLVPRATQSRAPRKNPTPWLLTCLAMVTIVLFSLPVHAVPANHEKPVTPHRVDCLDVLDQLAFAKMKQTAWMKFGGVLLQSVSVQCNGKEIQMQLIKGPKTLQAVRLN